jgi:outer membrane protein OmpA-like peptidoglycan-associated protein
MHTASRRFTVLGTLFCLLLVSGCATKKYARTQAEAVDAKVSAKVTQVETQTRENAERIDAVDKRAQTGITEVRTAAATADTKATQAQTAATGAQTTATAAQQGATQANQGVSAANTRITTIENRITNLDRYTGTTAQTVLFKVNSSRLDDAAKQVLDGVSGEVGSLTAGYMIEIQGFASSEGDENYNVTLSERRAEVVQRYLVGKNIPLYRIAIVGLGEEKPVSDNKTRAGREQNRRVEVRVLRSN